MIDRLHRFVVSSPHGCVAGLDRLSIQANRACTTVAASATKPHTFAIELLTQSIEKRRVGGHLDSFPLAVEMYFCQDVKPNRSQWRTAFAAHQFEKGVPSCAVASSHSNLWRDFE